MSGNRKDVGFVSVFCLTCHLWDRLSLVALFRVWGVSVQPNLREDMVFSKIDAYGAVRKPHLPGPGVEAVIFP